MDLLEHEAIGDPSEAAPAGDPAEAAPVEAAPEAAAPEPQYLTAEQAAEIADARFNHLLSQYGEQAQAPQAGDPIDWNERLNPLDPGFGQNFVDLLAERDTWTLEQFKKQINEVVGPLSSQAQAATEASNEKALDGAIAEQMKGTSIPAESAGLVKTLVRAYAPALMQRLGPNAGASAAMQQAIREANTLAAASSQAGGGATVEHLHALTGASTEPGAAGGAINVPPAAKSPREVFERHFGMNAA